MLAQQVCCFTVPIADLDVVVPVEAGEMAGKPSVREVLQDARNKQKPLLVSAYFTKSLPGRYLGLSYSHHTTDPKPFFLFCRTRFKSFPLLPFTSLIYCTYIHFTFRANMQNLGHILPPFPQNSFGMGEAQIQLSWGCSPPLTSPQKCHCAIWQSSLYSSIHVGFGQARTKCETVNVQSM